MSQPNNQNQSHSINQRVARPKGDPMCAQGGILAGWFKTIHTWVPHLFEIMSDGIGEARRQQLRCLKWISIWRGDLLSIHYTRSIISRSDAVIHWYHQTLFKKEMEPRGEFLWKIIQPKSSLGSTKESLSLWTRKRSIWDFTSGLATVRDNWLGPTRSSGSSPRISLVTTFRFLVFGFWLVMLPHC